MKKSTGLFSTRLFSFAFALTLIFGLAFSSPAHADTGLLPEMNVFLPSTIVFSQTDPGANYEIRVYDAENITSPDTPEFVDVFSNTVNYSFDGFQIGPNDRIELFEYFGIGNYGSSREMTVTDLTVSDINIVTEQITGTSNDFTTASNPVIVSIFYNADENGNPTSQNQRTAAVIDGNWSVDFSQPQSIFGQDYGAYDIGELDSGTVSQYDADGDCTTISWWAPNPEVHVDPVPDTIQGDGWRSEVNISLYHENALLFSDTVQTSGGHFEIDLTGTVDVQGGQRIIVSDDRSSNDFTVSSIRIDHIDFENNIIYGYTEPYGTYAPDCTTDVVVMWFDENKVPINACFTYQIADATGYWSADFSEPQVDWNGNPISVDLTSESLGFIRQYDGESNGTWVEWSALDFAVVLGDLNGDKSVDIADVKMIQKYLAGKLNLSTSQLSTADYNQDGLVNRTDVVLIVETFSSEKGKNPHK